MSRDTRLQELGLLHLKDNPTELNAALTKIQQDFDRKIEGLRAPKERRTQRLPAPNGRERRQA